MSAPRFRVLRIGGRCYPLFRLPVGKLRRIAPWVDRLRTESPGRIPVDASLMAMIVSTAIAGNGPFDRLEARLLCRRFLREARPGELVAAMNAVLEMVSVRAYHTLSLVSAEFQKLIAR